LSFNTFTGDAIFLGRAFYYQISPNACQCRLGYPGDIQVAGRETGVLPTMDLTDFPASEQDCC
jgi:hypothetical protein